MARHHRRPGCVARHQDHFAGALRRPAARDHPAGVGRRVAPILDDDQQGTDVRAARRSRRAGGRRDTEPGFQVYDLADGLRSAEFDGGNTSAGCRTPDGMLWFPSIRGIVRSRSRTYSAQSRCRPSCILSGFRPMACRLTLSGEIDVKPGQQQVGIPLHRLEPARAPAHQLQVPARGIRQRLDRRRQPQNRLLHRICRPAPTPFTSSRSEQ